jgi:hypothetical protein
MAKAIRIERNSFVLNHDGHSVLAVETRFGTVELGYDEDIEETITFIFLLQADENHIWFRIRRTDKDGQDLPNLYILHRGEYQIRSKIIPEN